MERATHPVDAHRVDEHHGVEEHAPEPIARDPDLPTVSDTTLMFFAACALILTVVALLVLV